MAAKKKRGEKKEIPLCPEGEGGSGSAIEREKWLGFFNTERGMMNTGRVKSLAHVKGKIVQKKKRDGALGSSGKKKKKKVRGLSRVALLIPLRKERG